MKKQRKAKAIRSLNWHVNHPWEELADGETVPTGPKTITVEVTLEFAKPLTPAARRRETDRITDVIAAMYPQCTGIYC